MKHLINLERFKVHLANKFKTTLNEIDEFLQLVVFRHEISELNYKEFELLIGESKQKLLGFLAGYALELTQDWQELYDYSYTLETKMIDDDKPDTLNMNEPQFDADSPIKLSAQVGVTLNQILAKFGDEQSTKISNAISYAYANGLPNQELVRIIRGTRKNRYQDGILAITTRHAKTIAHTGTAIVANQAKQQFIHDNKDIIKGIKVIATLDLRTSSICRGLDGVFMPLDKARYPPYHFNCRSSFEIVYDGYQTPKQRASMDGVVKNQTYYEWLKNQPAQYQDEVLGKTRAKLFRDGGMTVERFRALQLDKHFTPLTLEQMRALEPKAFDKAFAAVVKLDNTKDRVLAVKRTDWGDLPNVMIAHTKDTITTHKHYQKAKSGELSSALFLVDEYLTDDFVLKLHHTIKGYDNVRIVPVHAEEQLGRNKIPMAYALALSEMLGVDMDLGIVQAKRAYRTSSDGVGRLLKRVSFDGVVLSGHHYMIIDDVITQGGTLADLRGFIESKGGKVILASTLNGKPNSAKLPITKATLGQLRKQAGKEIEQWWQEQFGYDFSQFTESEARYLAKQIHRYGIDAIRDILFASRP